LRPQSSEAPLVSFRSVPFLFDPHPGPRSAHPWRSRPIGARGACRIAPISRAWVRCG